MNGRCVKMNRYKNLVEMLMDRRAWSGGITFIDGPEKRRFMSYGGIYQKAAGILFGLQERGLKPGDELIFQINDNRDFIGVFWACLMGKIIPVPVTEATNDEYRLKLLVIWEILKNPYLVTSKEHLERLGAYATASGKHKLFKQVEDRTILVEDVSQNGGATGKIYTAEASDIAYIQFSSGSTGDPKGVVLTHKNLLTNLRANIKGLGEPERGIDRYFSWMPLTHDMGLIGFHLTPMAAGWEHTLMAPRVFIRSPHYWLTEMAALQSTITVSPNFGYQYVLKHFDPARNPDLDLSAVRIIVNGAEPISPTVCDEFSRALAPFGLRKNAIFPAYGMAEASLSVTLAGPGEDLVVVHLDRNSLRRGERVSPADSDAGVISLVEVGTPVLDCSIKIVDEKGDVCQDEVIGEILIKGDNVTSGYYNNLKATAEAITADGWLRTGDLGFLRRGRLVVTGRAKEIIFSRGQNYYPHDIERAAEELEGIEFEKIAVSGVYSADRQSDEVICFVVFKRKPIDFLPLAAALREHIVEKIGIDVHKVIPVRRIPKTTSGKIQRYKLRAEYLEGKYDSVMQEIAALENEIKEGGKSLPGGELEKIIAEIWQEVLHLDGVMGDDNFFDLGGNSSQAMQVKARLQKVLGTEIDDVALFKYPTIKTLSEYFSTGTAGAESWIRQREHLKSYCRDRGRIREKIIGGGGLEIAVIGMAGRFPGARSIGEFWNNLKAGMESISFFSDEELSEGGLDRRLLENPDYVKARGLLEDLDYFDDSFFGYTPLEAEQLDPQMRVFFECAWEVLEDAGYDPFKYSGLIGVYAGASPNPLWETASLLSGRGSASEQFTDTQLNDKDFMSTWLSYKLNLKGPSFIMYTACSTSLAAVDLACQGLWIGRCDMALAGGVSIWLPQKMGYLYEEGMIFSRDGHNRAFDEEASGTIFSDGIGLVLLKRPAEAVDDGDHIYAVIKGSGVNNDGDRKVGYTAPALDGQAEVIAAALHMADAAPESIGYVEAHGTATVLGDPIEIEALKMAFPTDRRGCCAVGSVKSNIGHLNAAAGIAGFIKAVLAIWHRLIPPSPLFEKANRRIDFNDSPFYVNTRLQEWKNDKYPLRAGVSSFGIGGTNAHVILEEAPKIEAKPCSDTRRWKILMLSARTERSLGQATQNLLDFLKENPGVDLTDVAYTLQAGRRCFRHRRMSVCLDMDEAIANLSSPDSEHVYTFYSEQEESSVVFMFPGQGSQYVNMGLELYKTEPVFRSEMDRCFDILKTRIALDIKRFLYPGEERGGHRQILHTKIAQPILFIFEYALAKLLMSWGIQPQAMIGHSIGEYVAACLAGVFPLEYAITVVALRGKLMQKVPTGAMLSVPLSEEKLKPYLNVDKKLSLAAVNGPEVCTVSGSRESVNKLAKKLAGEGYDCRYLHTSHAFHSPMMEPILDEFEGELRKVTLGKPGIPYISNISGTWINGDQAADPGYWVSHLRQTVRFSDGVTELLNLKNPIFVEVGPGNVLGTLVRKITAKQTETVRPVVSLVRHPRESVPDARYLLENLGRLWLYGLTIDWESFYPGEFRHRMPLPTYPFDRQFYGITGRRFNLTAGPTPSPSLIEKRPDISDWFYIPLWKQSLPVERRVQRKENAEKSRWLVFADENTTFVSRMLKLLQGEVRDLITVKPGGAFNKESDNVYVINPGSSDHYDSLVKEIHGQDRLPEKIIHLWGLNGGGTLSETDRFDEAQAVGFYSLLYLAQALGKVDFDRHVQVTVVTDGLHDITGEEVLYPGKATVLGPVITVNQECVGISSRSLDVSLPEPGQPGEERLIQQLLREFEGESTDVVVAYRNNHRWVRTFERFKPTESAGETPHLRKNGVYLITGGLGGIGFVLAKELARQVEAKLVLIGRTSLPPREEWEHRLAARRDDDPVAQKLEKVRELERSGAEVLVFGADVADRAQMESVVHLAEERLGPINGVIHAAGIVGRESFFAINELDRPRCRRQFKAKVDGLLTLAAIFGDGGRPLDFCLLMSSISSLLGGLGLTAYAAANLYMDAFVLRHNRSRSIPVEWLSVNWDMWRLHNEYPPDQAMNSLLTELSMTAEEGVEVFHRILSGNSGLQTVVSTGDLSARLERWVKIKPPGSKEHSRCRAPASPQARKGSLASYAAPRNQVEEMITDVLQEYFGCEQIGIHDNFFDLGATSMDLMQINRKLNTLLGRKITLTELMTHTTVSSFAAHFVGETVGSGANNKGTDRQEAIKRGKKSLQQKFEKRRQRELSVR
jgi:acyl transferase domain-containing protein/acyl-CoA synthetase (AMP-forming)/AMP-acid ligase II/acyl carrier protein